MKSNTEKEFLVKAINNVSAIVSEVPLSLNLYLFVFFKLNFLKRSFAFSIYFSFLAKNRNLSIFSFIKKLGKKEKCV